jgi:hypothetical protein
MDLRAKFLREFAKLRLRSNPGDAAPVTAAEIETLPEPAQRYLRFMGVVGRPRDWSFRVGFEGWLRFRPHRRFMACEAWQYTSRPGLARAFHALMRFGYVVPVFGRDFYANGQGRTLIRFLDLYTLADTKGDAHDASGLVSYLNDVALLAPSMLLGPEVTWSAVDRNSFALALTDRGRTVSARVLVDQHGALVEFTTMDRYYTDPDDPKNVQRVRWTTPVSGWERIDGRQVFTRAEARWHLPAGLFTYADFRPISGSLAFNVPAGE